MSEKFKLNILKSGRSIILASLVGVFIFGIPELFNMISTYGTIQGIIIFLFSALLVTLVHGLVYISIDSIIDFREMNSDRYKEKD
jgi:hypothetical protein